MQHSKMRVVIYCTVAVLLVGASVAGAVAVTNRSHGAHNDEQSNSISGQVVDQSNKPARLGATVHVCGNACFEATTSIINGTFSVSDIPPGHYAVYGEQKSCKSLSYTLSITESETIGIPFALILDQCS